jgi:hypothetical protein
MKKRIIALSVAVALGGVAGTATAQNAAESLAFNPAGVGHILYVPYFSTQSGNVSAVSIVNTDTVNGKVLKLRFRGAANSDDVYDFQVFLSPGDVWSASIYNNGGLSHLSTTDKSCTLPANVNGDFIITRTLGPAAADRPGETREGYLEVLNMGDIVDWGGSYSDLYDATKHEDGVADCTSSVLTALTNENAWEYMTYPTTGLMGNWIIINVDRKFSFSGPAATIEARDSSGFPGYGQLVYWDQRGIPLTCAEANNNTADPLLRYSTNCATTPWVAGARYDLPDLSTPYAWGYTPIQQAGLLSDSLATVEAAGEFYNVASVGAQTDWVVSFPTRRYLAAVRYTGSGAPAAVYNVDSVWNPYFTASNTAMGTAASGCKTYQLGSTLGIGRVNFFDREETATVTDDIVISPGTPVSVSLCGEVSVVGINATSAATSATFGALTRINVGNGFTEGWGSFTSIGTDLGFGLSGLPFLANQFTRVNNTVTNEYYGWTFPARIVERGYYNVP